jgi:transcriptional regulator with XRE-family HTH domain
MRRRKIDSSLTEYRRDVLLALAQRGWTVDDLARASGCDRATLRGWLAGTGAISQADRERIAAALG